jgi:hypothetical protein
MMSEIRTDTETWLDMVRIGARMTSLVTCDQYKDLKAYVLDPMRKAAFDAFKKLDPADVNGIIQTQKIGQVIDQIEKQIETLIMHGRVAKDALLKSNEFDEEDL